MPILPGVLSATAPYHSDRRDRRDNGFRSARAGRSRAPQIESISRGRAARRSVLPRVRRDAGTADEHAHQRDRGRLGAVAIRAARSAVRAAHGGLRASLRADDGVARRGQRDAHRRAAGERRRVRICGSARSSTRTASAPTRRPRRRVTFAGFGIVSPEREHDDYRDAVRGRIALILDREPGVNDPASPFDGVVTAEVAPPLKKVLAAQEKGAVGVIFVEDVHNQSGPRVELPGAGGQLLAGDATARRALHAESAVGQGAHSRRAGVGAGRRAARRVDRTVAADAGADGGNARRRDAGADRRDRVDEDERRAPDRARSIDRRDARGQRSAAEERIRPGQRALRSRRRRRPAHLQRRGRRWVGDGGRWSKSPKRSRWRRRPGSGRSDRSSSRRGTRRSAACSARGRTPRIRSCRSIASSPCSTWT